MIRCIAIDDEPIALQIIAEFTKRIGNIQLTTYSDPVAGMEAIQKERPDCVFLDISMGESNGIALARQLPEEVCLVFTTAYAEFALEGFELDAVDFLHKPFAFERFQKAVEKVQTAIAFKQSTLQPASPEEIIIKVEHKNVPVRLNEIVYVEAMDNYVRIHLQEGRPIISLMRMNALLSLLPDTFWRIHKSYIVPQHAIAQFTRTQVVLHHKKITLPVGRTYSAALMERFGG